MQEKGFTIIELLIGMSLSLVVAAIVSVNLRLQSDVYLTDIKRIRIQQNLRSAMDIVSMNVRQAGEGLDGLFPALLLTQQTSPKTSILSIRRKTLPEVLLACKPLTAGTPRIFISDAASPSSDCLPANISSSLTAWNTAKTAAGGSLRIYIYDSVSQLGEFLDFTTAGSESGNDYVQVSALTRAYPAKSTSLYVLEEFQFYLDTPNKTLMLKVNGYTASPDDIAYNISDFTVSLRMQNGTVATVLMATDPVGWKGIRSVILSLSGVDKWRTSNVTRTLTAEYFPRNVLSK